MAPRTRCSPGKDEEGLGGPTSDVGEGDTADPDHADTQSAVSQQIAALERIVGTRVLERPPGRRPAGLTPTGRVVLRHAEAILARLHAAQADVDALAAGTAGNLRVGTYESIGARVLPAVLREFATQCPDVDLALREAAGDAELLGLVEQGELDLTFAMLPTLEGPFESTLLLHDPYVLAVAAGSPLVRPGQPPTLADIAGLALVGFHSCRNEQRVESHLRSRGIRPNVVFRSITTEPSRAWSPPGWAPRWCRA